MGSLLIRVLFLPFITKILIFFSETVLSEVDLNRLKNSETKLIARNLLPFSIADSKPLMELFQLGIEFGVKYGCADVNEFWYGRKSISANIDILKSNYDKKFKEFIEKAKKDCSISIC